MKKTMIEIFIDLTKEAEKRVKTSRKEALESKKNQQEMKIVLEKNLLVNGNYPADILDQYSNAVSDLKKKSKNFADSTDFFHKCVKHLQRLQNQKYQK